MIKITVAYNPYNVKSLLNKHNRLDDWYWISNNFNPYRGCAYGCEYCDGRSEKYGVEDFDNTIQVKANASSVLEKELRKQGYKRIKGPGRETTLFDFSDDRRDDMGGPPKYVVGVGGGVTDPYQPAEKRFEITRMCLEVLRDYDFPVHVLTKSDLVLRDAHILKEINHRSWVNVTFTITTFNEEIRRIFEPRAPSSERRLKALVELKKMGIHTGIALMPVIPFIEDTDENIGEVVKRAKDAGADYILWAAGMTLREDQKRRFYSVLDLNAPDLIAKYKEIYAQGISPPTSYLKKIAPKIHDFCKKYDIPERIPRYAPEGAMKTNLLVSTTLFRVAWLLEIKGREPYKIKAYRNAALSIERLELDVLDINEKGELEGIPYVGKNIAKKVAEILETGRLSYLDRLEGE